LQQHHYQPGHAIAVCEAHETLNDDQLRLTLRWGYATQGISESMLREEVDERPIAMRRFILMKRTSLTVLTSLLLLFLGCATLPPQDNAWKLLYEQEKAARQDQDTRIKNLEIQQKQEQPAPRHQLQPLQPQQQRRLTRAETMHMCDQVEADKNLLVHCRMLTLDNGTQMMTFLFANRQKLTEWWENIPHTFAGDYCQQSNAMNIATAIGQYVLDVNKLRLFRCKGATWSAWLDLFPKARTTPRVSGDNLVSMFTHDI
jgi:hypothetical protein